MSVIKFKKWKSYTLLRKFHLIVAAHIRASRGVPYLGTLQYFCSPADNNLCALLSITRDPNSIDRGYIPGKPSFGVISGEITCCTVGSDDAQDRLAAAGSFLLSGRRPPSETPENRWAPRSQELVSCMCVET